MSRDILDLIDNAIADGDPVSGDAMRWTPDAEKPADQSMLSGLLRLGVVHDELVVQGRATSAAGAVVAPATGGLTVH